MLIALPYSRRSFRVLHFRVRALQVTCSEFIRSYTITSNILGNSTLSLVNNMIIIFFDKNTKTGICLLPPTNVTVSEIKKISSMSCQQLLRVTSVHPLLKFLTKMLHTTTTLIECIGGSYGSLLDDVLKINF